MRRGTSGQGRLLIAALLLSLLLPAPSALADAEGDPDALIETALKPWTGDLAGIKKRGFLRMAIPHNPLFLAYDGEARIGVAAEIERELEAYLRKKLKQRIDVILMPLARDRLLPAVVEGQADIAAANLTITPERADSVAFSKPTRKGVAEIIVSGPAAGDIASFDDLAEVGLHLRRSSSYYGHVQALNAAREAEGKRAIPLVEVDEVLEDYDLLEMVQAGIIEAIPVDDHKAALWAQVFDRTVLHGGLVLAEGRQIAWALRKESPELMTLINGFVATIRKGSLLGNILDKRYLQSSDWVERVDSREARARALEVAALIRDYAGQYDFDWIMILAQGFQESGLDQSKRSPAGAIGIMQLLPTTARDPNVAIPDITKAENNVHAGVKYLRFLRDRYFSGEEIAPLDRVLFSFAAYNAGPGNLARARKRAGKMGLNPDVWFGNVEIAAGKAISREPVIYVRNIFKYSVAYALSTEIAESRRAIFSSQ
ncbi:transglycosylase SLT domain-containing protein [Pelagibius sp.]|uniref:transglycosylase SLT domain-containing protein n=1 Tax=Pelagibius sp. TaxID=1931238 RepID=UPI003BB02A01